MLISPFGELMASFCLGLAVQQPPARPWYVHRTRVWQLIDEAPVPGGIIMTEVDIGDDTEPEPEQLTLQVQGTVQLQLLNLEPEPTSDSTDEDEGHEAPEPEQVQQDASHATSDSAESRADESEWVDLALYELD